MWRHQTRAPLNRHREMLCDFHVVSKIVYYHFNALFVLFQVAVKHVAKERVTEWGTIVSSLPPDLCVWFVLVPPPLFPRLQQGGGGVLLRAEWQYFYPYVLIKF